MDIHKNARLSFRSREILVQGAGPSFPPKSFPRDAPPLSAFFADRVGGEKTDGHVKIDCPPCHKKRDKGGATQVAFIGFRKGGPAPSAPQRIGCSSPFKAIW